MTTLAQVWSDPALRKSILANPRPVLRELGIAIPEEIAMKAIGSRGAPSDRGATLLQIVLEREPLFSYFFMPSPLHPSAQQGAYGMTIGSRIDDPVFEERLRADAAAALQALAVPETAG